ncbi:sensor domain-containing protein [Mycobacterium rhizamassiliense]|nr:sensor domain-containing diguanylate cyclase [Mycobacterium rhizamassiliense]
MPAIDVGADPTAPEIFEQRYRRLVDHSPDAICVHAAGLMVYINPAGVRWMAAESSHQMVGHPITEFVHPDSIPPMLARIGELRHEGDASEPSEALMQRFDGTTLAVEAVSVLTVWENQPAYQVIFRDLTSQKAAEEALRYQAALVNYVTDAIIATTSTGIITSWNPAAAAIYGRPASDALALPVSEAIGAPIDLPAIVADGGLLHATHHNAHGAALTVRVSVTRMSTGYVLMCSDQTALRRAEKYFQTVVASLEQGVVVVGHDGHIELMNPAAKRIIGLPDTFSDTEIQLSTLAEIPVFDSNGERLTFNQSPAWEALTNRPAHGGVCGFNRFGDGRRLWVSVNGSLLSPDDPESSALLVSFIDVTEQYNARQQLAHEANHDALTGLANRAQAMRRISDALVGDKSRRLSAVLFIDLDNLKAVNDSLGHDAGDELIRVAADRLRRAVGADDLVARFAGDEFVAVIVGEVTDIDALAARLHQSLSGPAAIAGSTVCPSASIGIVVADEPERRSPKDIVRNADLAMYQAKGTGPGATAYWSSIPDPHNARAHRMT